MISVSKGEPTNLIVCPLCAAGKVIADPIIPEHITVIIAIVFSPFIYIILKWVLVYR